MWLLLLSAGATARAQTLETALAAESPQGLARAARDVGDPRHGALLFHQAQLACARCHSVAENAPETLLGPNLAKLGKDADDASLVESILSPSKVIRQGYESTTLVTQDGKTVTGRVVEEGADQISLRDASAGGQTVTLAKAAIEDRKIDRVSLMPAGQVNQLPSRQDFLDLVRYLIEIRDGGPARAAALQPDPAQLALVLPEYEAHVDHAGLIAQLDRKSLERGEAIYTLSCANCHGTRAQIGSLPTSLRFAWGRFKNGSDPFAMYQTITRGFGMMAPQTWLVPRQKYDVIHYIRETYLKPHNPTQYAAADPAYLARLPRGDTAGPEPKLIEPWVTMDYGPSLINSYEVGTDGTNFAYKGIAVRLDPGPGGVARGHAWTVFDHDTLRVAASWTGDKFIDWNGIAFNGRHQVHPRVVGDVVLANPSGPGWANPETGRFDDDQRVRGRDGRAYGPLPRAWAHYRGLYHHGSQEVIAYRVGTTDVLEALGLTANGSAPLFTRTFNLGPRARDLVLQVARHPSGSARLRALDAGERTSSPVVLLEPGDEPPALAFDGKTSVDVARPEAFDLTHSDFTIAAKVSTRLGGTIFAKLPAGPEWAPDGKALFVREGRLCFDIGWVGVVQSRQRVDDGRWHDVAATWDARSGTLRLFVDGRLDGQGVLRPEGEEAAQIVRLGYAAPDFPAPQSYFDGKLDDVRFYHRALAGGQVDAAAEGLVAHWQFAEGRGDRIADRTGQGHDGSARSGSGTPGLTGTLVAGLAPPFAGSQWLAQGDGNLRLRIPAGAAPLRFTLWMGRADTAQRAEGIARAVRLDDPARDLAPLTRGGPPRWPQPLTTEVTAGRDAGPFAVDSLTPPEANPWLAQVRLTGFDFEPGGDRAAVSSWDGDVWLVSGLNGLPTGDGSTPRPARLTWQRIASGLFQPLGVKIVGRRIHVICRDQLAILHDLNGDGAIDFVENLNNDHQVTEHFHEFAMGLQTDDAGNFYYAKSARHALPAVVPHHGTLLRVSKDGTRTDIIAQGFRAANGVCLNPDGTFYVTDQQGHWTPENRINLVKPGGFYGNMFGYHDVTDTADAAMEKPLAWISAKMDRSPGELLWVDSPRWQGLRGELLNLSYGQGKVFLVLRETVDGQVQGGMTPLPIPALPTGIMRGRFHPVDGQLYACGMYAWAGDARHPGGFYRIRTTGKPLDLPIALHALKEGLQLTFTDRLDPKTAIDVRRYAVKTWSLRRTSDYGSPHENERPSQITGVRLADDGRSVFLAIPEIQPAWCMEITYALKDAATGEDLRGVIHNTIHKLAP
ncbi:MAG: c-type cytochrome [Isosphaeraceae bacterium]|nr:c-type cytochrome [Isosphaeraceae bacterium]